MKLGDVFKIDEDFFYVTNIDRRENEDGISFTVFLVDETARNKSIETKINQEMIMENQRKAGKMVDKVQEELEEPEE